jgi:hypothetical protein
MGYGMTSKDGRLTIPACLGRSITWSGRNDFRYKGWSMEQGNRKRENE